MGAEEAAEAAEAAKAPEGLLNFGKIPLGGGFAINLDIPETGIVNIAVLIAGLFYLLDPILSESMASREKEITEDIDDAIAKFNEATQRRRLTRLLLRSWPASRRTRRTLRRPSRSRRR